MAEIGMAVAVQAPFQSATVAGDAPPQPPPASPQQPTVGSNGRLRDEHTSDVDRNYAIGMHLSPLITAIISLPLIGIVPPLVLWLIWRDKSAFADDHGREVLNFQISYTLFSIILFWTLIGPAILWVIAVVSVIRGAVAAGNSEYFRYPITIRFLS